MDGAEFRKIRSRLNLSAAALGHALGYEGSDANISRTVYRLETGRNVPKPIERLLKMFDEFGVPRDWVGEVAQRKHRSQPRWANFRPANAAANQAEIIQKTLASVRELEAQRHTRTAALMASRSGHGQAAIPATAAEPEPEVHAPAEPIAEHGQDAIPATAAAPQPEPAAEPVGPDRGPPKQPSRSRRVAPLSSAAIKAAADRAEKAARKRQLHGGQ
jgi:hypothetical protein